MSILAALVAVGGVATGVLWTFGVRVQVLRWEFLMVHMALGAVLVPLVVAHLAGRFRAPSRTDFEGDAPR